MKVTAIIEKGVDGTYDVTANDERLPFLLLGQGDTVEEAINDFYITLDDMKATVGETEHKPQCPADLQFDIKYDVASFLNFYSRYMSLAGLSRLTGINQKLLSHYINGRKHPKKSTVTKIEKAIHDLAKELSQVEFV